jgi:hypothetical protein
MRRFRAFISNKVKSTWSNLPMNKFAPISAAIALTLFVSCGKQQTEAERNAEIERQVQQRLAAQQQADAQQQLVAREADLAAREKALAAQQNAAPAETSETPVPRTEATPEESSERDVATNENASYNTFYTRLDPYGDWRETADYGYVFQPRVATSSRKWRPYTNGRWVYTDAGWTWVSEEPFGWATYHYGRWTRLRNIGWVWVPGDEWAPAWVSWRKSNDYVGWAPLPPEATFDRRAGIHQWADNQYDLGPERYAFVPANEFGSQRIEQTVVPPERNVTIVSQTINVTNITYNNTTIVNQGPNYEDLSRRSQRPIERLRLERGAQFEGDNPRAIVRGEVIAVPAPFIAPAQRRGRPVRVKEAIRETVIDHDAAENADQPAAEKARAKMRAESTPPPGLPPKKFVKPAVTSPPVAAPPRLDVPKTIPASPSMRGSAEIRGKELDPPQPRREAQPKAEEERKVKQMGKPIQTPAPSVATSPVSAPTPAATSSAKAIHTPLPEPSIMPPRKPVQDDANLPLPTSSAPGPVPTIAPPASISPIATSPTQRPARSATKPPPPGASVPKKVPPATPLPSTPPARTKTAPRPTTTLAPAATVPARSPARNLASPPVQKALPPSPRPTRPSPPVPNSSPAEPKKAKPETKTAPKGQPSPTPSPRGDGKGPRQEE